jgi:hypothetical protein
MIQLTSILSFKSPTRRAGDAKHSASTKNRDSYEKRTNQEKGEGIMHCDW